MASPAGFEPATCGLEIRCCYPTELRGRDGEAFTPRSPSSASAATAAFAGWPGDRRIKRAPAMPGLFSIQSFRSVRNGVVSHGQIRSLIAQEISRFWSNFAVGLTLDVPAFTFSIAAAASFFWSTALV